MDIMVKKKMKLRGEDGMKSFNIRIPIELCDKLDDVADSANISRNELIKTLLSESIDSVKIEE